MISGHDIARVGTNSDISYYASEFALVGAATGHNSPSPNPTPLFKTKQNPFLPQ